MYAFFNFALLATLVAQAFAHYRWTSLIVNGTYTKPYANVRNSTNFNYPVTDVSSTNLTCNVGGRQAGTAKTATVTAGSKVGFALDEAIFHQGVVNVYMAKAPTTAAEFDGSGQVWFRIYELPPITDGGKSITFPSDNITDIHFDLPSTIPSGEYLLRIEHIALHLALDYQKAEFYVSCAQLNVIGGGSGVPTPLVALPGYYTGKEPGILVNIYQPIPKSYLQPGPEVWVG
ncbi:glycoside hydrolase family 61 protein [Ceratobasidium sp. AG-Ba]|nr:glycoside hydrolase family 61 protein [Ceratobasidium sp. AG-Ba]